MQRLFFGEPLNSPMALLLALLVACGPHLDADGACVTPTSGELACPTDATCRAGAFEAERCGDYTRVTCADSDGFFGATYYCDADGNAVAWVEGSDTEEFCDGRSYELTHGTVPGVCGPQD